MSESPSSTASASPSSAPAEPTWFCLRTEGKREHLAALNLTQRAQVEAFAPRIRVRRERKAGGVDTVTEALFPGYIFARFSHPVQTRHVVSTTGVLGVVSFGGQPPSVPDATITQLRSQAEPPSETPIAPVFNEGDWVRVAGGCFRGTEGKVRSSPAGQDRVLLLLSLLGHEVEVTLPAEQLLLSRVSDPVTAGRRSTDHES